MTRVLNNSRSRLTAISVMAIALLSVVLLRSTASAVDGDRPSMPKAEAVVLVGTAPKDPAGEVAYFDVYIDTGNQPLAAYQLDIKIKQGDVRFAGFAGGIDSFEEPPYYDPRAMVRERAILAAFLTDDVQALPKGRVHVASVNVEVRGDQKPQYEAVLSVAAGANGEPIKARLVLVAGQADGNGPDDLPENKEKAPQKGATQ